MWVIFRQNYVHFIHFSVIHPLISDVIVGSKKVLGSFAWHGSSTLLAKESYKVVLNNGTVWGNKVWKKLEKKVGNNVTISSKCLAYYCQDPNFNFKTYMVVNFKKCNSSTSYLKFIYFWNG